MSIISFYCFKSYFYFIVYWIIALIITIIELCYTKYVENKEYLPLKEHNIFPLIYNNISDLLTGILVLIANKLTKSTEKEEVKEKHQPRYELIYKDNTALPKRTIILISVIDFVSQFKDFIFALIFSRNIYNSSITLFIFTELIFKIIFSRFFL
jgi:hypothetical protein